MNHEFSPTEQRVLRAVAEHAPAPPAYEGLGLTNLTHRPVRPHLRALTAVAAIAAVLALIGVALLINNREDSPPAGPTRPAPTPLRLVPTLPESYHSLSVSEVEPAAPSAPVGVWVLVRDAADGAVVDRVTVSSQPVPQSGELPNRTGDPQDATTVTVNGNEWMLWNDVDNGVLTLDSRVGGQFIAVKDDSVTDVAVEAQVLQEIAASLRNSADDVQFGDLPMGYRVGYSSWWQRSIPARRSTVSYVLDDTTDLALGVVASTEAGLATLFMNDDLRPLAVRGRPGFVSSHTYPASALMPAFVELIWEEAPGQWVVLGGEGQTVNGLLRTAEGLRVVDERDWQALFASPPEPSASGPTTTG